jgi:hypothetical protein
MPKPVEPGEGLPAMRTIDGVTITQGMAVIDYDLNPGKVDLTKPTERLQYAPCPGPDDIWFDVIKANGSKSLMNPSRVWAWMPYGRPVSAEKVLNEAVANLKK